MVIGSGIQTFGTTADAFDNQTDRLIGITTQLTPVLGVFADSSDQFTPFFTRLRRVAEKFYDEARDPDTKLFTIKALVSFTPRRMYVRADCPRYGYWKASVARVQPKFLRLQRYIRRWPRKECFRVGSRRTGQTWRRHAIRCLHRGEPIVRAARPAGTVARARSGVSSGLRRQCRLATGDFYPRYRCHYYLQRRPPSTPDFPEPYRYIYCANNDRAVLVRGVRNAPRPPGDDTAGPPPGHDPLQKTDLTPTGRFAIPTTYGGAQLPAIPRSKAGVMAQTFQRAEDPRVRGSELTASQPAVAELRKAETALHGAVMEARRLGDTWAVIGAALGVTRQAARKRYGGRTSGSTKERQRGSYS